MKDLALKVAGVIFFIVAVAHLLRVIFNLELIVGSFAVPIWTSVAGFIFALALALWMFKSLK